MRVGDSRRQQRRAQINARSTPLLIEGETSPHARRSLRLDTNGAFAFCLVLALLFMAPLPIAGAAIVVVLVALNLYVRRARLGSLLVPRAFLFIFAAFALLSVVWSEAPDATLKAALQFGVTVLAGLLLSAARDQAAVLRGMALAFLVCIAAALVGGQAFSSLIASKTVLANLASTVVLVSIIVVAMAVRSRGWLWVCIGLVCLGLGLYSVSVARSAGALLGLAMGVGAILSILPLLAVGKAARAWLTSAVLVCLLGVGLSYRWLAQTMIEAGPQTFHRDPTLSGRIQLWRGAADLIQEKPVMGRGYDAFWTQGNPDAEGLWRYVGIEGTGFAFHSTVVEVLVALGWVGLILFAATVLVGVVALIRRFAERPSLALVFWVSIFLHQLALMPMESTGLAPFHLSTVLAFGALGAAFGRVRLPPGYARSPAYQQPSRVQVFSAQDIRARDRAAEPILLLPCDPNSDN